MLFRQKLTCVFVFLFLFFNQANAQQTDKLKFKPHALFGIRHHDVQQMYYDTAGAYGYGSWKDGPVIDSTKNSLTGIELEIQWMRLSLMYRFSIGKERSDFPNFFRLKKMAQGLHIVPQPGKLLLISIISLLPQGIGYTFTIKKRVTIMPYTGVSLTNYRGTDYLCGRGGYRLGYISKDERFNLYGYVDMVQWGHPQKSSHGEYSIWDSSFWTPGNTPEPKAGDLRTNVYSFSYGIGFSYSLPIWLKHKRKKEEE